MINYKNEKLLTGLRGDNLSDYFRMMFEVWLIENSKEVVVDGEKLTGFKKNFGAKYGYNTGSKHGNDIKKPSSIIASGVSENGIELNESLFAKFELERVENITDGLSQMMEFARLSYVEFLEGRIKPNSLGFENDLKKVWFKVGVLLAMGKIDKYISDSGIGIKADYSPSKIAKELGNPSFEKYILATLNDYPTNNSNHMKNIFNRQRDMQKIYSYCKQQGYPVSDYFTSRIKPE